MRLSRFIHDNMEAILREWEAFARSLLAPGQVMTSLALRDHAKQILQAIAEDMESDQTDLEQIDKSKGFAGMPEYTHSAAQTHGVLRHLVGFDLRQLAAEYRALRASVLRLWLRSNVADSTSLYQLTRFNEAIDQALAESISNFSDEVARSRDTFLAILGHDLRTPLCAIANSGLYLSSPGLLPAGPALEAAKRIGSSAARMNAMIRDLLEYTRTRLGRAIPISPEPASMGEICRVAIDEARTAHPEKIFRLETSGALEGQFDAGRFHQVLSNLLTNAVKHGASSEPITLRAYGDGHQVIVQVKNRGRPIPEDQLQVIFNPLVQIPPALLEEEDAASTSLGLGLYIAREIVVMHGGTMAAESDRDGTVFSAHLPRVSASPAQGARA